MKKWVCLLLAVSVVFNIGLYYRYSMENDVYYSKRLVEFFRALPEGTIEGISNGILTDASVAVFNLQCQLNNLDKLLKADPSLYQTDVFKTIAASCDDFASEGDFTQEEKEYLKVLWTRLDALSDNVVENDEPGWFPRGFNVNTFNKNLRRFEEYYN